MFFDSFTPVPKGGFYVPFFDQIGVKPLKSYELFGYLSPLTFNKCSRKKFRRNK